MYFSSFAIANKITIISNNFLIDDIRSVAYVWAQHYMLTKVSSKWFLWTTISMFIVFFTHCYDAIHLSLNSKYVQLSKWNIVLPFWSRKFDFNVVSIAVYGRVNTKCDIFLGVRENRLEKQKINRRTSDIYICIDINRCRLKCFDIWCLMVYERRWFHR